MLKMLFFVPPTVNLHCGKSPGHLRENSPFQGTKSAVKYKTTPRILFCFNLEYI